VTIAFASQESGEQQVKITKRTTTHTAEKNRLNPSNLNLVGPLSGARCRNRLSPGLSSMHLEWLDP